MATIKSHTDLSQSKKLAEFLPLESADMYYTPSLIKGHTGYFPHLKRKFPIDWDIEQAIPCWSLAALLSVLPRYELNNFGNAIQLSVKREALETEDDETLLDLVVNMIIHLHELKML